MDPFEPCLHKHVPQSEVIGLVEDEDEAARVKAAYDAMMQR